MIEVQFHSKTDGWIPSQFTGCYGTTEELIERAGTIRLRPYRYRIEPDLPWQFLPMDSWPERYRTGEPGNYRWYSQLDNIPQEKYPVLDCLIMDTIHWDFPPVPPTISSIQPPMEPQMTTASATLATTPDALVDLRVGRVDGKLTLEINAKPLHDLLDSMGARFSGTLYSDRPQTSVSSVSRDGKISTELLLRREYPVRVAVGPCFERPPTIPQLKAMCESGHTAVSTILGHYQPVDISYRIVKVLPTPTQGK